jgi:hypothetical protein
VNSYGKPKNTKVTERKLPRNSDNRTNIDLDHEVAAEGFDPIFQAKEYKVPC